MTSSIDHTSANPLQRPHKVQIGFWLLLTALVVLVSLSDYRSHLAVTGDGEAYVVLSESLFGHESYSLVSRAGEVVKTSFPFGFPLILSPLVALFPGQIEILKLPSLGFQLLSLALLFWGWPLLSSRSHWWGLGVAALFGLWPTSILYSRLVLSEMAFITFVIATILLVEMGVQRRPRWWWYPAIAFTIIFTVFTRTIGLSIVAGLVLYFIWRRRQQAVVDLTAVLAIAVTLLALVIATTSVAIDDILPAGYIAQYDNLASGERQLNYRDAGPEPYLQFLQRTTGRRLYRDFPAAVVPGIQSDLLGQVATRMGLLPLLRIIGLLASFVIIAGVVRWLHLEGVSAFFAAMPLYVLVLVLWAWQNPRFLLPIQPQLVYAFLLGIEAVLAAIQGLWGNSKFSWSQIIMGGAVMGLIAFSLVVNAVYPSYTRMTQVYESRGQWITANAQPSDVILSTEPDLDYLYGHHLTIGVPPTFEFWTVQEARAYFSDNHIKFAIMGSDVADWKFEDGQDSLARVVEYDAVGQARMKFTQKLVDEGVLSLSYAATDNRYSIYTVIDD